MWGKKKVIVKVCLETGEVTIEAIGYNGKGCREATEGLERILGTVTDRITKATMYNQSTETTGHIENRS